MLRPIILLACVVLFHWACAQTEIEFYSGEKIRKENDLFGIKRGKDWVVPPKYDKIEGFGGWLVEGNKYYPSIQKFLLCHRGEFTDVYEAGYNQPLYVQDLTSAQLALFRQYYSCAKLALATDRRWANAVDPLTPEQQQVYDRLEGICAFVKDGKWGYVTEFYTVAAQYDSLFTVCQEDPDGTPRRDACDEVVGVKWNGRLGVITSDGRVRILNHDYVGFRYRFTGGSNGKFEIICRHRSGVEVVYDRYSDYANEYIETRHNGLVGYVTPEHFIAPKYTEVLKSDLPMADHMGRLPDGTLEYLRGQDVVPASEIAGYQAAQEREAKQRKSREELRAFAERCGLSSQVITSTHSFYIYPGWEGVFPDAGRRSAATSTFGDKEPDAVFAEAPAGWIRDAFHVYSLQLSFGKATASSLEKERASFIDLAKFRSGWGSDRVKPTEERLVLPDGRKALVLFYVCPDSHGMVGGHFMNCHLYIENGDPESTVERYLLFIDGGNPPLPEEEAEEWKDYFKNVLLTVREN